MKSWRWNSFFGKVRLRTCFKCIGKYFTYIQDRCISGSSCRWIPAVRRARSNILSRTFWRMIDAAAAAATYKHGNQPTTSATLPIAINFNLNQKPYTRVRFCYFYFSLAWRPKCEHWTRVLLSTVIHLFLFLYYFFNINIFVLWLSILTQFHAVQLHLSFVAFAKNILHHSAFEQKYYYILWEYLQWIPICILMFIRLLSLFCLFICFLFYHHH